MDFDVQFKEEAKQIEKVIESLNKKIKIISEMEQEICNLAKDADKSQMEELKFWRRNLFDRKNVITSLSYRLKGDKNVLRHINKVIG